ncbi:MAG: hypothetical protein HOY79_17675 [Streptomyces sp.]|nr:hypothetical protein [Streptomyces sp.]
MNIRQIYVIDNQDWLGCESNLTDQQAYDAIVDLWLTVSEEQYDAAMADLATAGLSGEAKEGNGAG